jgi:C4-dicarboxylate transporter/malic acid transport protein
MPSSISSSSSPQHAARSTPNGDDPEKQEEEEEHHHHNAQPPSSANFRDRIAHFTWPWFASTMSTGAMAVVLANTPNRFTGLTTIGKIFFILDLILFALFTTAMGLRACWFPRRFLASLHHPVEGLFFGAYWVSASLILNAAQAYGVPACGPWLVTALRVGFWMYCGVVWVVAVGQYYVLFHMERLSVDGAVPAWIFPVYPLLVVGTMGGTMIPSQPQEQAFDMWVGAVLLQGMSWMVAVMMYGMYVNRLMSSALPPPSTRPGMYVSVGPAGYTAAGLMSLGTRASSVLPSDTFGVGGTAAGETARVVGILAGMFVILFAGWFCCISTVAVLAGSRRMSFTLNWWAFVFPNAGLALATIQLGSALSSSAINGVASAMTVMLVVLWIMTAVAHVRAVWRGEIMWPGKDEDKDMRNLGWGKYSA